MAQIDELQARITRALDRIGTGLDRWEPVAVQAELAAMRAQTEKSMSEAEEARAALAQMQAAPPPEPEPAAPQAESESEELSQLREALEDEKLTNAQLEDRLRTLTERQENETASLHEQVASGRAALAQLDGEMQSLRASNAALQTTIAALREANAGGLADADLINKSMADELVALRAERAVEAAEARAVLDALTPMLAGQTAAQQASAEDQQGSM